MWSEDTERAVFCIGINHAPRHGGGSSKFWVVADSLTEKRTDTALIRVVVYSSGGHDDAAAATASQFADTVYPLLRERLYPQL